LEYQSKKHMNASMNASMSAALLAILVTGTATAEPDAVPNLPSAQVDTGTIEEIVVTARRRSEDLQSVPGEVTAVTASDLSQIHARSFEDFAAFVPGLSYQTASPATNLIAIRGITTGGSQLSSAIGLYLDEIPLGASTSFGLGYQSYDVNVFDLDRVEVLNGPQGTLYGASSLGGALRYITAAPNPTRLAIAGETEVSSTEHGGVNDAVRGMINLPIGAGLGAVRIDAIDQYDTGYLHDPLYDRSNQGSARTTGGRVSLLLAPTSDVSVRLNAFSQRTQSNGFDFALRDPVTRAPTLGTYEQAFPLFQPAKSTLTVYSGIVSWDSSWAKLTSITGYQINHGVSLTDVSEIYDPLVAAFGAGADAFSLPVDTTTKRFTQEVRLASQENKQFEWLAGAYFDHERTLESVDLFDASNPGGALLGIVPFNSVLPSTYRELAGYLDATAYFTDRFDMTLGARYSQNRQTYGETVFGLFATGSSAVLTPPQAASTQSVTTYLINPRYRIGEDSILYARIASGFRPGGPNFVLKPGLGNPTFSADTLWNYELGEKYTFLDKKASLDVDIFDIQWKDIQLTGSKLTCSQRTWPAWRGRSPRVRWQTSTTQRHRFRCKSRCPGRSDSPSNSSCRESGRHPVLHGRDHRGEGKGPHQLRHPRVQRGALCGFHGGNPALQAAPQTHALAWGARLLGVWSRFTPDAFDTRQRLREAHPVRSQRCIWRHERRLSPSEYLDAGAG
jgi:iron complex outermembrane recepter protein